MPPQPDPKSANPFYLLLEKVFWTFVEVFVAGLAAADAIGASTSQAAAIAGFSAVATVLANGLPEVPAGLPFVVDLLYRTARTYAAAFFGLVAAIPLLGLNFDSAAAAAVAAIPAGLAIIKGAAASRAGVRGTAATLPRALDSSIAA